MGAHHRSVQRKSFGMSGSAWFAAIAVLAGRV